MDLSKKRNGFLRTAIRNVDEENYRITHTINTKGIDRYNTIVLPKGVDAKHFLNNAVVLWSHNMDEATPKIPIGKCVELDIKEDEIVATTEFNSKDTLAMKVFNAYRDGFLHAWSVGFMPLSFISFSKENREDLNKAYGLSVKEEQVSDDPWETLFLIDKWELYEYSAVPVPGNPEALSAKGEETFKRELLTRGLVGEEAIEEVSLREEPAEEAPAEEAPVEEVPVEEAPVEDSEEVEEEETIEEQEQESEEIEEDAEEEGESDEEVEDSAEKEEDEEEKETEEVEEDSEEDDEVAEEEDENEEQTTDERQAPEDIENLVRQNTELSNRVAELEERIKTFDEAVSEKFEKIQKSLDVKNIDKVREASKKRKEEYQPGSFFKSYLVKE